MAKKVRLDSCVQNLFPHYTLAQIQSWIMQGKVFLQGEKLTKPGTMVLVNAPIECTFQEQKYVSRAGFKLEKALDTWNIQVSGKRCLDAGLSTGGFADCLLQRGAASLIGVDVGYSQVHLKVRDDARVKVIERTNLRYLDLPGTKVDLITLDLSFISVLKVMSVVVSLLVADGELIVLIKPQFEADRKFIQTGGVVTDPVVHKAVIDSVCQGIVAYGFICCGVIESPIQGSVSGNREFLGYFRRTDHSK